MQSNPTVTFTLKTTEQSNMQSPFRPYNHFANVDTVSFEYNGLRSQHERPYKSAFKRFVKPPPNRCCPTTTMQSTAMKMYPSQHNPETLTTLNNNYIGYVQSQTQTQIPMPYEASVNQTLQNFSSPKLTQNAQHISMANGPIQIHQNDYKHHEMPTERQQMNELNLDQNLSMPDPLSCQQTRKGNTHFFAF